MACTSANEFILRCPFNFALQFKTQSKGVSLEDANYKVSFGNLK